MTQILAQCPDCKGAGTVPHVQKVLADGEVRNPNNLDQYQTIDTCWPCLGSGKRLVEINVMEPVKQTEEPYCGC